MADFIVNESRFMLDDDESYETRFLPEGLMLPDGIEIGEKTDDGTVWQHYFSADGKYSLLVAVPEVAEKWLESGLLKPETLEQIEIEGRRCYLLISPAALQLLPLSQIHCGKSLRLTRELLSAFFFTRSLDHESCLRDAVYSQLFGVLLPCYRLIPKVDDKVLFENALRAPNEPEKLGDPAEFTGRGISEYAAAKIMKEKGLELPEFRPWLENGDPIADFAEAKGRAPVVTGALSLREHYQIYNTSAQEYLLLLDQPWAEALMHLQLLSRIQLRNMPLGGKVVYALTFSIRRALENLDERIFGLDSENAMELARALRRTRKLAPTAELDNALYSQELGLLLPEIVKSHYEINDVELMRKVLAEGPYATAPLLDEIAADVIMVATAH